MSKALENFAALLQKQSKGNKTVSTKWAIVESVDWANRVCDVKDVADDLPFYDVILGLGTVNQKPVVGAKCLIGIIEGSANSFLIHSEECELIEIVSVDIVLNDGSFGGLIKVNELKSQIAKNTNALSILQQLFTSWVPVPSDGGASLKALLNAVYTSLSLADLSNIENKKVKHGE